MTLAALAAYYPIVASRIPALDRGIRSAHRVHVTASLVRDLPATLLRRAPGDPVPNLLWTGGYRLRHNRYVRKDAFPAYHVSDGVTTVSAEVFGVAPEPKPVLGVPKESRLQLVVDVDLPQVLDLTNEDVRAALDVTRDELVEIPNWLVRDTLDRPAAYELPQCVGELAFSAGAGGVQYHAAHATAGVNLVVFADNLESVGGSLRTKDPVTGSEQRLP